MTWAAMIPIGVVFILVGLPIICLTLVTLVRMFSGGGSIQREALKEETRMIQEIHAAMEKLEDRIESLEAIVVERDKGKETKL